MVALAAASGSAAAEWVSIGDQGTAVIFVDKTTITRVGDTAKMWQLQELKTARSAAGATYVSLKQLDEYDCKDPRTRGVEITAYPKPMAEGTAVASQKGSGAWAKVVPESTNEMLWKIACGKE
ncbi:MAG: surface-adhesin E family protein [Burkholderiales bacterium]